MKKKIALIQMQCALAEPETNYRRAAELMETAMKESPDILVLPETWNTGFYASRKLKPLCDAGGERTISLCGNFAKEHHVNIVAGSVSVLEGDKVYNRAHIFDRHGNLIETYDKIHGFSFGREPEYFAMGSRVPAFTLDGLPCSMVTCYDIRFPELMRREVLAGAELIFVPAAWPLARLFHWKLIGQARAVENQVYLCQVNEGGLSGKTQYGGNSALLDPWGEDVCRLDTEEGIAFGEIDTDRIREVREMMTVLKDRRAEIDFVK